MNKLKVNLTLIILIVCGLSNTVFTQVNEMLNYRPETGYWFSGNAVNSSDNALFTWQSVSTPISSQVTDICFTDSLNGWLSHTGNGSMHSTNSGFNWIAISFSDTNFSAAYNSVHFINQNTGWCAGSAVQIRKTTDGGITWFKQYGPPVAGIARSVYFLDANTGIICGSKNFPYVPFAARSTNGGISWIEQSPSFSGAQELNDQYWFNANTGWICGYDVLLYTTDGGVNFSNLYPNIPPSGNGHISLLSVTFLNQQTGWLGAATSERKNLYKTTNGGLNWEFINNPISQGNMNQINDIKFYDANFGWAVHGTPTTGAIMFTSNGGTNWTIEEQSMNWFDCLHIYQDEKVWCGAGNGMVWYILTGAVLGIKQISSEIPDRFSLYQNYPNPFNPVTKIKFGIPGSDNVKLSIFDMLGREIAVIVNNNLPAGNYEAEWNGSDFPSGAYIYQLSSGNFTTAKKLLLVK